MFVVKRGNKYYKNRNKFGIEFFTERKDLAMKFETKQDIEDEGIFGTYSIKEIK